MEGSNLSCGIFIWPMHNALLGLNFEYIQKKKYCVGSFSTEEEAAEARDKKLVERFGPQHPR